MDTQAFNPTGGNVAVAASTTTASGVLPGAIGNQIRIHNAATGIAFCRWTIGASSAVATDNFVSPGGTEIFSINPTVDTFSVILSAGTGDVYAQKGFGL